MLTTQAKVTHYILRSKPRKFWSIDHCIYTCSIISSTLPAFTASGFTSISVTSFLVGTGSIIDKTLSSYCQQGLMVEIGARSFFAINLCTFQRKQSLIALSSNIFRFPQVIKLPCSHRGKTDNRVLLQLLYQSQVQAQVLVGHPLQELVPRRSDPHLQTINTSRDN